MIKVNKGKVQVRTGDAGQIVAELFCAIVAVFETMYVNGDEDIIEEVIKPELEEIMKCKTLEEFIEYQEKE